MKIQREPSLYPIVEKWMKRHFLCFKTGVDTGSSRTLDTLHVACALELKAEHFWTFDERQAKLALAEGLKTG